MAKFRQNHKKEGRGRSFGSTSSKKTSLKYILWFVAITILMIVIKNIKSDSWESTDTESGYPNVTMSSEKGSEVDKNFLPISTTGTIVHHKHYSLSYDEEHEQAEWVAYKLTEQSLRAPNVKRAKRFNADRDIPSRSAVHSDYSHSGYTRGHLAPAGDMAFSIDAMQESFFMSNMSPQLREFNGGIWRELEETVRDWAFDHDELLIVTGPVLKPGHIVKQIGKKNKISVPDQFFKIILDNKGKKNAIAFLMPNELSTQPIKEYVVPIDEIEQLIGIDFFADFLDEDEEQELESSTSTKAWKFDTKRFENRVRNWNKN